MGNEVDDYLAMLKEHARVNTDTELAQLLGKPKQTISSWRRRGTVPTEAQYEIAERFGPELALFPEVRYATTRREAQIMLAVFLGIFDDLRDARNPALQSDFYLLWAQAFDHCQDHIRSVMRQQGFSSANSNPFFAAQELRMMVRHGEIPEVQRAIDIWVKGIAPIEGPDPLELSFDFEDVPQSVPQSPPVVVRRKK